MWGLKSYSFVTFLYCIHIENTSIDELNINGRNLYDLHSVHYKVEKKTVCVLRNICLSGFSQICGHIEARPPPGHGALLFYNSGTGKGDRGANTKVGGCVCVGGGGAECVWLLNNVVGLLILGHILYFRLFSRWVYFRRIRAKCNCAKLRIQRKCVRAGVIRLFDGGVMGTANIL